ncbi:MAG: radical SAM protein [Patescibacteria group bacterium]
MNRIRIPTKYIDVFVDEVDGYFLAYNPLTKKGLTVLNKEASFLFSLIDGKRSLEDILTLAQKKDKTATFENIKSIIDNFVRSEIVYFDKPKSKSLLFNNKPTHLEVWFHITNQCNLRCTYCYVYKTPDKMSSETAKKAVDKIIYSAQKHGFKNITFKFAGGEPLLEFKQILSTVSYARTLALKNNIEIDFVIISNGVLLTDKACKILKENKLRLAISIDGLGKYHDKTRIFTNGLGSFKYIEKGIENVQKNRIPFNVSITVTSKNIDNIPTLTKWLLKKNIPFVYNFYRENPNVKEELEGDDKKLVKQLKKAYQIIGKNPPRYNIISGLLDRVNFERPHLYTCGVGLNYIVIRHDGKLISCQMTQNNIIGSIDDEDLIETMLKGNFIKPKNLTVENKSLCKDCQWKYVCCGGCPLLTNDQKGSFDTNSPYCNVYKALIPEVLKIEARRLIKYRNTENQ